ncbi:transposase [Mycobacteroides abscessus]|uniref:transposase n=1 Tax=Mycobacteroides abscessus TaxID=36809 RepID=UPI0037446FFA
MLTVVHDAEEANGGEAGRSLLDEIVRDGARQMLAAALQAEVAAYVAAFADQLDENGHRLVVRNGYHQPREVLTAAGAVQVKAPRTWPHSLISSTRTVTDWWSATAITSRVRC